MEPKTQKCPRCIRDLPLDAFAPGNQGRGNRWCRECFRSYNAERWQNRPAEKVESDRARMRAYRAEHKAEHAAMQRDWHARHPTAKRAQRLLREFGLTLEAFDALAASQGGLCAICRRPPHGGKNGQVLHVDHDHETGVVRGLLCGPCNTALGLLAEDHERIDRVIHYLTKAR